MAIHAIDIIFSSNGYRIRYRSKLDGSIIVEKPISHRCASQVKLLIVCNLRKYYIALQPVFLENKVIFTYMRLDEKD